MLVIVEGPDGSGKTTLIHRIKKDLGSVLVLSRGGRLGLSEFSYFHDCVEELNCSGLFDYVILDREPWVSEAVYGKVIRKDWSAPSYLRVWNEYEKLGPVKIIHCWEILQPRSEQQMEGVLDNLREIQEEYESIISSLTLVKGVDIHRYHSTHPIENIIEFIKRRET